MQQPNLSVLLACPGLEHARRGFESFARGCFDALRGDPAVDTYLVKGSGGSEPHERAIPTLRRDTAMSQLVARAVRRPAFVVEHVVFSLSLIPLLLARRPDIVYFSEWHVGRALALWRRATRGRFKLVLCNGTSHPGPYDHLDLVQQLTPGALQYVLDRGADPERLVCLPYGFHIPPRLALLTDDDRAALRARLELPAEHRIVISVAALNRQKRIDYLVEEIAAMPDPRPFLLLVGQVEEETAALRALAEATLGAGAFTMRTVPREEVEEYLKASDIFVLGSLWEGLPLALVEAMASGLPCIAHRHPVMEYAVGDQGNTIDLERPGALREQLTQIHASELTPERAADRHRSAYERFSWDTLRPQYVDLFRRASELPPRHRVDGHAQQGGEAAFESPVGGAGTEARGPRGRMVE
jgi:1,2-diacylglycerol 3-alpha-glucosyltransferase